MRRPVFCNSACEITVLGSVVHARITDSSCPEGDFEDVTDALLDVYLAAEGSVALILHFTEIDVSTRHIPAAIAFLTGGDVPSDRVAGTAVLIGGVLASVAECVVESANLTRPIKVVRSEEEAADFVEEVLARA